MRVPVTRVHQKSKRLYDHYYEKAKPPQNKRLEYDRENMYQYISNRLSKGKVVAVENPKPSKSKDSYVYLPSALAARPTPIQAKHLSYCD